MAEIGYNERTGLPEYWNNATNQWTTYNPDEGAPPETFALSKLTLEDIKNRVGYKAGYQPWDAGIFSDSSQESAADPSTYYSQLAGDLVGAAYGVSSVNQDASDYLDLIEGLKDIDPKAYYTAKIDYLSRNVGHNVQSNEGGRAEVIEQQLQGLLPEAQKAGLTPEEINATYESGYSKGGQQFGTILNLQQQEQQGFLTPLIEGLKVVGPGALGMYGIDQALIAGLGAAYGAGTGLSSVGIGSGLGTAAELSGVLASGAGSLGASGFGLTAASVPSLTAGLEVGSGSALAGTTAGAYTVPAGGAVSSLGSLAWNPPTIGGSAGFLNPILGADVASTGIGLTAADIPSLATGLEVGTTGALQNLDPSSSLLSKAGDVLKGAQLAKGLLGVGKNPLQPQSLPQQQMQGSRQYAGVDYSPILNLLNVQQPQRNRNSLLG